MTIPGRHTTDALGVGLGLG